MRSEVTKEVVASVTKKNDAAGGDVMKNTEPTPQSAIEQSSEQHWDCAQTENSAEEEVVMAWCEDDELKKQWEEVSRVEEKLRQKKQEEMCFIVMLCKECRSLWPLSLRSKAKRWKDKVKKRKS